MAAGCQVLLGSYAPSSAVSVAKSFMALVSGVTKETTCVEESIAGFWHAS